MTALKRRDFFGAAALAAGGAVAATRRLGAQGVPQAQAPPALPKGRPAGPVEVMFKAPGPKANGLQATKGGLWILDQGNNHVYLVSWKGEVLRDLHTESVRGSGITFDGQSLWLAATYSREIVRCDPKTGATLQKYFTPGAGVIYRRPGDAPGRRSPLAQPPDPSVAQRRSGSRPASEAEPGAYREGTGGHGLEWRDGRLWLAVPPSRTIYRIHPETWVVEHTIPAVGNRPHGIGFEGDFLWETDSNLNAFFKRDIQTGAVLDRIQLADSDPLPHGMTIWEGHIWYCDDVPNAPVCRVRIAGGTSI